MEKGPTRHNAARKKKSGPALRDRDDKCVEAGEQRPATRRQEKAYAEDTEFAEKRKARMKRRGVVALERRSPPFAKDAKDGAPSSTCDGRRDGENPSAGHPASRRTPKKARSHGGEIVKTWDAAVAQTAFSGKSARLRRRPLRMQERGLRV